MIRERSILSVTELLEKQMLFIGDGYRAKNSEFDIAGIPFARIGNISDNGEIDLSKADLLPEQALHKVGNKISQPGDIVFTSKGSVGRFIFVKADMPQFVYSPQLSFWRVMNDKLMVPRFLIYWMQGSEFQEQIHGLKSQTDMADYVSLSDQRRMMIMLPPFPIQQRIAEILGRLDDKIEVNRRINRTLEAMGQALYKHWFVDFGPFQDGEFVESELGLIPQGWRVATLEEAVDINPLRSLRRGQLAPYLDMANMPTSSARALNWIQREFNSGMRFLNGDVLVARITPCLENGKTAYVDFLEDGQVGWGSTEYIVLRSKPPLPMEFAYLFARTKEFRSHAIQHMTGTSGRQRVSADSLKMYQIVVPTEDVAKSFGERIKNSFKVMKQLDQESAKLTEIRDYLLPKLLSGEIPVEAATEQVDEVTEHQQQQLALRI